MALFLARAQTLLAGGEGWKALNYVAVGLRRGKDCFQDPEEAARHAASFPPEGSVADLLLRAELHSCCGDCRAALGLRAGALVAYEEAHALGQRATLRAEAGAVGRRGAQPAQRGLADVAR